MTGFNLRMKRAGSPVVKTALDIGTHSIKMLEVTRSAEKLSLVSFGMKKIGGSSDEAISDAIKALSEELKITAKDINISIAGPSVVARVISMPDMTSEDLKSAVRFETEKSIPFDINECILDFHIQGKDTKEKNNLDILLAAAKKDFVLAKIKLAEDAGFGVNLIDVDSFAVTNAFLGNFTSIDPGKTIALLNIGATHTDLVILRGGLISFVRNLATGVNDFCALVSKKCGVDLDLPDALKRVPAEKMTEVAASAKGALSGLVEDVKLSFGYYENQSGRSIDEIYVSGGGAGFTTLEDAFNDAFGSKPERWNPLKFLDAGSSGKSVDEIAKVSGSFAVSAGLVLR